MPTQNVVLTRVNEDGSETMVCGVCKSTAIEDCKSEITNLQIARCHSCGMRSVNAEQECPVDKIVIEVAACVKAQSSILERAAAHFHKFTQLVSETLKAPSEPIDTTQPLKLSPDYEDPRFREWAADVIGFHNERITGHCDELYNDSPETELGEMLADAMYICCVGMFGALRTYGDDDTVQSAIRTVLPAIDRTHMLADLIREVMGNTPPAAEEDPFAAIPAIPEGDTVSMTTRTERPDA